MTAADLFREIEARQISIVPALGLWVASVDERGGSVATRKRKVRSISGFGSTPAGAVRELVAELEGEPRQRELVEEEAYW